MEELIDKLKVELIEALNLEEITPEDIDSEAPLFGDDGLGDVSMGIICKTVKQADKLYAAINHLSDKICLLTEESVAFVNGVVITTAHMAKGLEFDEVIVPFVTDKDGGLYPVFIIQSSIFQCHIFQFYIYQFHIF